MLVLLRMEWLWHFPLILPVSADQLQHAIELALVCRCLSSCVTIGSTLVHRVAKLGDLRVRNVVNHARVVACSGRLRSICLRWGPVLLPSALASVVRTCSFELFFGPALLSLP